MDFRFLIARRYLAASRRVTLVSIISGLSVAGVALGVTALIVVLSVMNGFYGIVRDLLVSFDPHVRIESAEGRGLMQADSLLRVARGIEGVESAAAYVEGKALLTYEGAPGETQVVDPGVDVAGPTVAGDRVEHAHAAGGEASIHGFHVRAVVLRAHVLEHPHRYDGVEASRHVPVVLDPDLHREVPAGLPGDLGLLRRDGDAERPDPISLGCISDEAAPSAPDVQQRPSLPQAGLAADEVQLRLLGLVEGSGVPPVAAGVDHPLVEHGPEQVQAPLVVVADMVASPAAPLEVQHAGEEREADRTEAPGGAFPKVRLQDPANRLVHRVCVPPAVDV